MSWKGGKETGIEGSLISALLAVLLGIAVVVPEVAKGPSQPAVLLDLLIWADFCKTSDKLKKKNKKQERGFFFAFFWPRKGGEKRLKGL